MTPKSCLAARVILAPGLASLTEREYLVLERSCGLDGAKAESYAAIAADLGVTRMAVRQCAERALVKLRHALTAEDEREIRELREEAA